MLIKNCILKNIDNAFKSLPNDVQVLIQRIIFCHIRGVNKILKKGQVSVSLLRNGWYNYDYQRSTF